MEQYLVQMISTAYEEKMVGYISRDATAIVARVKPVNTKKEVKPEKNEYGDGRRKVKRSSRKNKNNWLVRLR